VLTEVGIALLAAGDADGEETLLEGASLARRHGRSDVVARGALALAAHAGERPDLRSEAAALVDAALDDAAGVRSERDPLLDARLIARRITLAGAAPTGPTEPPPDNALAATRERLAEVAGPDHLDERVALARDLAVLADAAGDPASSVVALHEQAMVAAFAGDADTVRSCLVAIAKIAADGEDGARLALGLVAEHRASVAAMTGQFGDAMAGDGAAQRLLEVVRWMRAGDDGAATAGGATLDAPAGTTGAVTAGMVLEALARGDRDSARRWARELTAGVHPLPADDERLHALGILALAVADLGDRDLIGAVYHLLAPYADLTCGIGYRTFVGAAAFHLGRLSAVAGDWSDAERHTLVALRRHTALRARPWVAFSQRVLADVLEARGRPSDREWVAALRAEAGWASATLGLRTL
jgi:hypothetical protein